MTAAVRPGEMERRDLLGTVSLLEQMVADRNQLLDRIAKDIDNVLRYDGHRITGTSAGLLRKMFVDINAIRNAVGNALADRREASASSDGLGGKD